MCRVSILNKRYEKAEEIRFKIVKNDFDMIKEAIDYCTNTLGVGKTEDIPIIQNIMKKDGCKDFKIELPDYTEEELKLITKVKKMVVKWIFHGANNNIKEIDKQYERSQEIISKVEANDFETIRYCINIARNHLQLKRDKGKEIVRSIMNKNGYHEKGKLKLEEFKKQIQNKEELQLQKTVKEDRIRRGINK